MQKTYKGLQEHAQECFPQECCGLVVGGVYLPKENIHENPLEAFAISNEEYRQYEGRIEGVVHSHVHRTFTYDGRVPSKKDMELVEVVGTPSGIIHCKGADREITDILWYSEPDMETDLIGRRYIPNYWDCYTLVREWHLRNGWAKLPYMPRSSNWMVEEPWLLQVNLDKYSIEIHPSKMEVGDIILVKLNSQYHSHLGIYTGGDTWIHHVHTQNSMKDSLKKWERHISGVRRCK